MSLEQSVISTVKETLLSAYGTTLESVELQPTRKEFDGEITVVVFPMLRVVKDNPVKIGEVLGKALVEKVEEVTNFNVVKGFLNLVISDSYFLKSFRSISDFSTFGILPPGNDAVMVEYASPNTNKPIHLGHMRNIFLGFSVANILKASGKKVYKTQIINDRGIHICKSMWAWQQFGNGETPEMAGLKGDKLVGNYYVKFSNLLKEEVQELVEQGMVEAEAEKKAASLLAAQDLLRKWESGDPETLELWKKMNGWVYDGWNETYRSLGVDFDSNYYESNTYLLGKDNIAEGLQRGVFYEKDDGSIWCDLTDEGLDEKLVLRSDGTAVYMTQDIGTAIQRVKDHPDVKGMVYTVGNEQDYHFRVLFLILKKLGYNWAENLYHLSYGMVDLPSGKMKGREGTVVDADDLIEEMRDTAQNISEELGKIDDLTEEDKNELYHTIGMGALKYFILKVDPKKRILFNPEESVDFQGNTGPFIQYTYARIQSILRKSEGITADISTIGKLHPKEKDLIKQLLEYPGVIQQAADQYSPALVANYTYELVKEFNSFYQNLSILSASSEGEKQLRVALSSAVGAVIKSAFGLLGIQVPERM